MFNGMRGDTSIRRVLHVVDRMDRAGVETLLMNVYRRLDRSGFQFDFAVATTDECDYDAEISALGGRLFPCPPPRAAGLRSYLPRLYSVLRNEGPFAALHSHVHHFSGAVLAIARMAGIPVRIAHSHTTRDGRPDAAGRYAYRSIMRFLILCNATHLLANSVASGRALYGKQCEADVRFQVVPNGIELSDFAAASRQRPDLRNELGLRKDTKLIGHVGRFVAAKNHDFLLRVFAELVQRLPAAHLVLVGDGPLRRDIDEQILRLGLCSRVHLLGVRSDVADVMHSLDVFVFPSVYEGLGNVVIEAQAAGVPCVVSDAVPNEADLGLGQLRYLNLQAGGSLWADAVAAAAASPRPAPSLRVKSIEKHGYNIERATPSILRIYEPARS